MIQINWHPKTKDLRIFSVLVFPAFCAVVGYLLWSKSPWPDAWKIPALAAAIVLPLGLAWPPAARIVYLALVLATYPIGFVVSHVLLAVVYYLVITPIGFMLRAFGKDPLHRRPHTGPSYWIAREKTVKLDRYFKQF